MARNQSGCELVTGGRPAAEIVWGAPDGAPAAEFAATELRSYVTELSGARLPVREADLDPDGGASAVAFVSEGGASLADVVAAAAGQLDGESPDAFALRAEDGVAVATGTTHRGTLYGAYALLEALGVRFFAPEFEFYEGHAERVPSASDLTLSTTAVESPGLRYRRKYVAGPSNTPAAAAAVVDWMAKTRHNVVGLHGGLADIDEYEAVCAAAERRGLLLEVGGHNFDRFLPRDEYADDHPEWFVDGYNVFDATREAAVETYVDNVVDAIEAHPQVDIFAAWPPDGAEWPPAVVDAFGGVANAYASVVNRLDRALPERLPDRDVAVEAIAYSSHLQPPDPEQMYAPSVVVDFAPTDRSYAKPIDVDPDDVIDGTGRMEPKNPFYVDRLEAWRDRFEGTLGVYEYYRKYAWHSLPGIPRRVAREIPAYHDLGAEALGTYAEPADWIPYELTHLAAGAMGWNPDRDPESLVEAYFDERFGPAGDAVSAAAEHAERGSAALFDGFGLNFERSAAVERAHEEYRAARDALERAEQTLEGADAPPGASMTVDRLAANLDFAVADVAASHHEERGEPERAERARERARELVEEHAYDGAVLRSRWSLRRTDLPDEEVPTDEEAAAAYRRHWDD
jgi:hypothetical protein